MAIGMRPAFEQYDTYVTVEDVLLRYKKLYKLDNYNLTNLTNEVTNVTKLYLVPTKAFECDKRYKLYTMSDDLSNIIETTRDSLKGVTSEVEDINGPLLNTPVKCKSTSPSVTDGWCNEQANHSTPTIHPMCDCTGGSGPSPGPSPGPQPGPSSATMWTQPPLRFPTTRADKQKVKWLYTCSSGQGTACQPGGDKTNNPKMIKEYGINYISLITGAPGAYPQALNACEHKKVDWGTNPAKGVGNDAPLHILSQNSLSNTDAADTYATDNILGCGTKCEQATETGKEANLCKPTLQGVISLPYTRDRIREVHELGCTVSLVLGAWNSTFPSRYNNNKYSQIYGTDNENMLPSKYAAIYYSRFMELRYNLDNALDGIDFDWEGFSTGTCSWKGGCASDWSVQCSYNGTKNNGSAQLAGGYTPSGEPLTCYQLADDVTLDYINAICEIFKRNPFTKEGDSNTSFTFKTTKKAKSGEVDSAKLYINNNHNHGDDDEVKDFGKWGPLSVTVVPMSSQQFSNKPWDKKLFNGQNQFVDLEPTNVDALLLQWYSGFDGGATTHTSVPGSDPDDISKNWMPPWLKGNTEQKVDLARGCKTGLGSESISVNDQKLPNKFKTSLVEGWFCFRQDGEDMGSWQKGNALIPDTCKNGEKIPVPAPEMIDGYATRENYVKWLKTYYPYGYVNSKDVGGRCSADYLFNNPGGYNRGSRTDLGRCPRRLDCPDWYYNDDLFMHQSQLYVLHNLMQLGWNPATQLIIGLEFFDIKLPAANWEGTAGGQQWGPVPDAFLVGGLDAAIKGVDAYNKYYDKNLKKDDYLKTFDNYDKMGDKNSGVLFEGGLAGVGGWTLAGANNSSQYAWKNFLKYICESDLTLKVGSDEQYKFPICNRIIPNIIPSPTPSPTPGPLGPSGEEYMTPDSY